MATQEYAASIQGVSIRVTRLDASGNLLNGPGDSYTTSAFMRVSFTPEYEEGDEITEKSANGTVCVTYKAPDTLKRITMELAICEPDAEFSQLVSGGLLLRKNVDGVVKSVGWAAPGVGDDPAGNGVAIEAWSHAVKDGKRASVLPYFHWVFPYAKLRQSGDRVIENGMLATTFEGYGLGNINFGSGSDGRWEFPVAAERPYSYSRASWAPVGLKGFYTWTDQASYDKFFTIGGIQNASTVAVSSIFGNGNVATVTLSNTATNAGVVTGDKIYVNNCGEPFNTATVGTAITVLTGLTTTANTTTNVLAVANTAGFVVGQSVVKTGGSGTLNTTASVITGVTNATHFTVTNAPTANGSVTFDLAGGNAFFYVTNANLSSNLTATLDKYSRVNLVDSLTEPGTGNYTEVTTTQIDTQYSNASSELNYNVPGNLNYVADTDVDFIIKSNED